LLALEIVLAVIALALCVKWYLAFHKVVRQCKVINGKGGEGHGCNDY